MKKLGKFEIIEKLGQGAMGVVYKARDPFIDRIVALKTLTTGLTDDPNLLKRFYSEARSAGGLQHPNIVTIYELGHEGDTPFIAMQFLSGESLDKIIDRRPNLPVSQKIGFIVHVCRALEYAHKQNPPVVHRDIKPGNVMVTTEGNVVVVDFGIARLGEGTRSQSAGMLIGTLGYMSPQLFRGGTADARSDIWATGVMFYELLAYQRPFGGDNAAALMSNIILEKPRSLIEAAPGTTPDIQAVVDRMLAKEAEARYQSMEEVLMELEPIWRSLQQAEVSKLLANSQQLFEAGDLDNAKAKVSQIIQIDTSNTQAKSLLEKINAEVRRKQIVPQLKARVERAERLLANGQLEDAKVEVEAALKVDSTFQPARELLSQAQAAIERAHDITQALRASKQRMAEGALTEAELQLDKVLALDPGNAAAREQLKQIREERSRRERRKQRDEALHRARVLWTNLQYEECINLLLGAQKQFPGDTEIAKLLESARQDQTEQQRQSLLTEARNLLSAQRFEEALRTLDRLLERYPSDATAKNLRAHAQQGREQQVRDQRLAQGKSKLQTLVKQGKYEEALNQARQLSREFPDDFELAELIDFARSEQSQLEQKVRLQELTRQIQQALREGRFSEAALAAEKALLEFPKNLDFVSLLDRAKKEQSDKERQDLLKQRLREVERLMDRQELTDAIDLAHRTQVTIGRDSRISSLLEKAQKELEFREKKRKEQNDTVQMARTLIDAGKVTDATSILKGALETQLFPSHDPRIAQLLDEIETRREPPPAAAAAAGVDSSSRTPLGSPISSKPSADPGKDYVYQRGAPLPEELVTPERGAVASSSSPIVVTGPSTQPIPSSAPAVGPQVPEKTEEEKRRSDVSPTLVDFSVTRMISPATGSSEASSQLFAPETEIEEPAVEKRKPRPGVTPISVEPLAEPAQRPLWRNPIVVGAIALVIAAGAGYAIFRPPKHVEKGLTAKPAEWDQAEQLMSMTPRHLGDALAKYQFIIAAGKDSDGTAKQKVEEIQRDQKRENDWMEQGATAQAAEHYDEALKDYTEVKNVNGDREKDAEEAIKVVNGLISGKKPLEIAQENLTRADQFASQSQWEQAVRAYKLVSGTKELTPDLRKQAADGLRKASAHLDEATLWARAQQSRQNGNSQEARNFADKVVKMNLDHRAEAQELISKIDLEFKASREDTEYNDLRQQVDAAKLANNVDTLKNLQVKARNIASANGKHAAEAHNIAESEIPNLLKTSASAAKIQQLTADGRGLSQSGRYREAIARVNDINQLGGDSSALRNEIFDRETRDLQALQNEYNSADKKNEAGLKALQNKVQQFINNASSPQNAQILLSSIAKSIDAAKTGPPGNGSGGTSSSGGNTSSAGSATDDAAIRQVFSSLSKVFDDRSAVELKSLWPQIPISTLGAYRTSFEDKSLKSVRRRYEVASLNITGDSAMASGIWTGVHINNGRLLQNDQVKWTATLHKAGGLWVLTSLE